MIPTLQLCYLLVYIINFKCDNFKYIQARMFVILIGHVFNFGLLYSLVLCFLGSVLIRTAYYT